MIKKLPIAIYIALLLTSCYSLPKSTTESIGEVTTTNSNTTQQQLNEQNQMFAQSGQFIQLVNRQAEVKYYCDQGNPQACAEYNRIDQQIGQMTNTLAQNNPYLSPVNPQVPTVMQQLQARCYQQNDQNACNQLNYMMQRNQQWANQQADRWKQFNNDQQWLDKRNEQKLCNDFSYTFNDWRCNIIPYLK